MKLMLILALAASSAFACLEKVGEFKYTTQRILQTRETQTIRMHSDRERLRVAKLKARGYTCKRMPMNTVLCHKFLDNQNLPGNILEDIQQKFEGKKVSISAPTRSDQTIIDNDSFTSIKVSSAAQFFEESYDYYLLNTFRGDDYSVTKLVFFNEGFPRPKQELLYRCKWMSKVINRRKKIKEGVWRNYLIEVIFYPENFVFTEEVTNC
jgi:hypothetical protein